MKIFKFHENLLKSQNTFRKFSELFEINLAKNIGKQELHIFSQK